MAENADAVPADPTVAVFHDPDLVVVLRAIHRVEFAVAELARKVDDWTPVLERIAAFDNWVDDYQAHERDGLPDI
jgi:hypothetical protein